MYDPEFTRYKSDNKNWIFFYPHDIELATEALIVYRSLNHLVAANGYPWKKYKEIRYAQKGK